MDPATAGVTETKRQRPLSIFQLLRAYPRERLYVHPILWTQLHLKLLGCEFADGGIFSTPPPPPGEPNNNNVRTAAERQTDTNQARFFAKGKSDCKWRSLVRLMGQEVFQKDKITFRYDSKIVANLPCKFLELKSSPRRTTLLPVSQLACLDLSHLERYRKIKKGRRRLYAFRPRDYSPLKEDPYMAVLLIALAQRALAAHQNKNRDDNVDDGGDDSNGDGTQMLLVTNPRVDKYLHVYTSNISKEFLARFEWPKLSPTGDGERKFGMVILHRRVEFEPYDTFRERFIAVLQGTT
ncbi:hypothetical protein QBC37DRAFT_485764 [Rhypophila decipiens]|uniref:Uncharacterized protein n=1 Tax=Rhypophila decipiens TaxID=261697 RepID=A0AAN7B238_9PEZI|nr:hypothetical protein QBC37DRAFT_485764 [Rhypophila decipiens]